MKDASDFAAAIARELALEKKSVAVVLALLGEGATVPFIARYRKEATGGLDEVQIRNIEERQDSLKELAERRSAILKAIADQGKLTDALRSSIEAATSKSELEDIYLPYKKKRRTRAMMARDRGLEPLAVRILSQPPQAAPLKEAASYVSKEKDVKDVEAALAGARDIVAELVTEKASERARVRRSFQETGVLQSSVVKAKSKERSKFEQYYEFTEKAAKVPSHRYLAIRRGESEGFLRASIQVDADALVEQLAQASGRVKGSPYALAMSDAVADGYKRLLAPSVENDMRVELKMRADREAVEVFADNLGNLLMAAPLGGKAVLGIDPGLRTGCKCVSVTETGAYQDTVTLHLTRGAEAEKRAGTDLLAFIKRFTPQAIAVGNGTGGRECERFVRGLLHEEGLGDIIVVSVSEAGASIYSASDIAREEFPDLDLTIRGAISIARRLQDPLAELVRLDPKSIGVGQYQHDVLQSLLQRKLAEVVESCVNRVGVALNTASASLLSYVSGISKTVAANIVTHRKEHGAFRSRKQLLKVAGVGPKGFEQAAGFLRIMGASNALDSSAVHPERYDLVGRMAKDLGVELSDLVGDGELVGRINLANYLSDGVGEPTLRDILDELVKPGRDPRASFEAPKFREDVSEIADLKPNMQLEGVVTNVTAFGAFVDVGVHQDGLVHISQLSDRFVKDPSEVVKVGDKLKVRVMEVDVERKRISLTAKKEAERQPMGRQQAKTQPKQPAPQKAKASKAKAKATAKPQSGFSNNPFASLKKG